VNANIGDFAEAIMAAEVHSKNKQKAIQEVTSPAQTPDGQVDISRIDVPASFVNEVLGTATVSEEDAVSEGATMFGEGEEEVQQSVETPPSEDNVISELREIKTLLSELKSLYAELTSVGSLGINLAGNLGGGKSAACDPFKKEQARENRVNARIKAILKKSKK